MSPDPDTSMDELQEFYMLLKEKARKENYKSGGGEIVNPAFETTQLSSSRKIPTKPDFKVIENSPK